MRFTFLMGIISLCSLSLMIVLVVLLIRALWRLGSPKHERQKETGQTGQRPLAEALKHHRQRCKMTQEFVAESLGVSRQAVSKWETGASEPSMENLLALMKLYGVSAEELL